MKRPTFPLWLSAWLGLVLVEPVSATVYYVKSTGNDNANGMSIATAWKTISKVNSTVFAPGDQILFAGGQTFDGALYFDESDIGTAVAPITVSSYGTGSATINAGSGTALFAYNTQGFVVSHLIATGSWDAASQTGNSGSGIFFYTDTPGAVKRSFIRVDQVEARGFKSSGIVLGGYPSDGSKSGYSDVQITNSTVHDNGDAGISVYGYFNKSATTYAHASVTVQNCTAYNNRGIVNKGANSGNGIVVADVNGGVIERCLAHDNGDLNNYSGGGPVGIWTWDANAITIQSSESYSNKSGNTQDGGGFDLDGGVTNSTFQYNYSHDNDGAGYLLWNFSGARGTVSNNTVRYNISQNDGQKGSYGGIVMGGGTAVKNNLIFNNTVFASKYPAFRSRGIGTGNVARNNLFITTGGMSLVSTTDSTLLLQNNAYWSSGAAFKIVWAGTTYTSLEAWRTATGQEIYNGVNTGLTVNPLVANPGGGGIVGDPNALESLTAYRLQTGSPLVNTGLALSVSPFNWNVGTRDFYGNPLPRGAGYDIGAHEADSPPSVTVAATATPLTSSGTTSTLSVSASDDGGDAGLAYHWSVTGTPPAPVSFGTNGSPSITAAFKTAGIYEFSVVISDASGQSVTSTVQITVAPSYAIWAAGENLSGTGADALADPDSDGSPNLIECALGTDPLDANSKGEALPLVNHDGALSLTFMRKQSYLVYTVQVSNDLKTWTPLATDPGVVGQSVTVTDTNPTASNRFLRLHVDAGTSQ